MEKFFTVISRINQILFLLVLIAVGVLVGASFMDLVGPHPRAPVRVVATDGPGSRPEVFTYGDLEKIHGSATLMLRLRSEKPGKSGFSSGGGYSREDRNVLFLTPANEAGRWLFKDHRQIIARLVQLGWPARTAQADATTQVLLVEYVDADSNGDGVLSEADSRRVALLPPDGTGMTQILSGIDHILSYDLTDAQHLSVLYQTGKAGTQIRHLRYSLAQMKAQSDQALAEVPGHL